MTLLLLTPLERGAFGGELPLVRPAVALGLAPKRSVAAVGELGNTLGDRPSLGTSSLPGSVGRGFQELRERMSSVTAAEGKLNPFRKSRPSHGLGLSEVLPCPSRAYPVSHLP